MLVECNRGKTRASLLLDAIRRPEVYLAGTAGCTGVGPGGVGLIGEIKFGSELLRHQLPSPN